MIRSTAPSKRRGGAEDMAQETMARAFASVAVMAEPPRSPRAWLFRIASNSWLNRVRQAKAVRAGSLQGTLFGCPEGGYELVAPPRCELRAHRGESIFLWWSGDEVHAVVRVDLDRRGRGDSENTPPYAVDREVEDLAALITAAGGSASVFGNSSGGLLALDAARSLAGRLAIPKLVLYEPPVILDAGRAESFEGLAKQLDEAAASDRRSEAVELYFTKVMQMPAPAVAGMRSSPMWASLERLAHTLGYDLRITARGPSRLEEVHAVRSATLVMNGGASPGWMGDAILTLARAIPGARHRTLEGQTHAVDPEALARAIEEHLGA